MPTIDVYPDVPRAYNRVEVNWADIPSVTHARVLRVDVESGTCTPLRPYICFDGDYLLLSCGHGIFWDTEVPLDRSVYYITEGVDAPCLPVDANLLVGDTFNRTLVNDWGSTETGILSPLPWLLAGGTVPGDYDVNGGKGRLTVTNVSVDRTATVDIGRTDFDIYGSLATDVIALTDATTSRLVGRFTDANNHYQGGINFQPGGTYIIFLTRLIGGVQTILNINFAAGTYTTNADINFRFKGAGNAFKLKAWVGPVEPVDWSLEADDTPQPTLNGTQVGILSRRDPANTNPVVIQALDNFMVIDECPPCAPVTVESEPSTMPSNGAFRLKDPVRPCNDIYMPLCFDQSNLASHRETGQFCAPGTGVFFASMETESYEPNTLTVNPTNARRPIAITRQRRDVSSNLTVVSRTFNDRDALLRLAAPGSPILLQAPPQYGIPDRYMDVGTVAVDRGLTDHKFQVRIVQMPHVAVDRPAGPQNGVCGSRVADLCDFTFDELASDGNTWEDLVRGRPTGGVSGYRTWDDVLTEFADWDDVNNGVRTWHDLEVGD